MMPGLGRRPSTDPRNSGYPMRVELTAKPKKVPASGRRVWGFPGAVLDQGSTSTCVGHAASHFIHCAPLAHKGFLDPIQLYREACLYDEWSDNDDGDLSWGSSGTGAARALHKRGLISGYLWANTLADAIEWVLTRGPVLVGTDWYDRMFTPDVDGYVRIGGSVAGGHEYLLHGLNTRRGVARFANSWGPGWNPAKPERRLKGGHFLMDFETLDKLFKAGGDIVSPMES